MPIASQSPRARSCGGAGRPLVQVVGVASQRKARSGSAGCTSRRDDRFPPQLLGRLGHRSRRRGRHVEKRRLARWQAEAGLAEVGGWGRTLPARGGGWRPRSASARRTLPGAEADSGRRTLPLPNSEKKARGQSSRLATWSQTPQIRYAGRCFDTLAGWSEKPALRCTHLGPVLLQSCPVTGRCSGMQRLAPGNDPWTQKMACYGSRTHMQHLTEL